MSRLPRAAATAGAAALALVLAAPTAALASDNNTSADQHAQDHSATGQADPSDSDGHDPAGNNGTIKIDSLPADAEHSNRPHPGCDFALKFFNFDTDQHADITFVGQAPTDLGTLKTFKDELISTTPADGALEADQTMVLSAADLGLIGQPQAKQGWHIKVSVDVLEAPGGAKHKVFWLSCPTPAPVAPTETTTNGSGSAVVTGTTAGTTTGATAGTAVVGESLGGSTVVIPGSTTGTTQGNVSKATTATSDGVETGFTGGGGTAVITSAGAADAPAVSSAGGALPFTGLALGSLVAFALAALAAGALAVRAGRRRTAEL